MTRYFGLAWAFALASAFTLMTSVGWAAPVIDVAPRRLDFPPVTVGDTVATPLVIANRGDAVLTVSAIDVPPGVSVDARLPFDLDPDSLMELRAELAAVDTSSRELTLTIHSNDPATPEFPLGVRTNILALQFEARALTPPGPYPLGEAIVIQAVAAPGVRVEQVTLHFRARGTATFQPQAMSWDGHTFVTIIPGSAVVESGVEFYATAENSGFIATDPPEADARPYRVDVGSPHLFALNPVIQNPGFIWLENERIDFLLTLERGTEFQSGLLHYRRGGETRWQETTILEMSFTGIAASIPADFVGPRGVEYWSEVTTLTRRLTDPPDNPERGPNELRITVGNLAEDTTRAAGRYRMLSIPLVMQAGTGLAAILTDEAAFGSYDPVRWRAFHYDPETSTNVELSTSQASQFTLAPGRAFWLISRDAHRVNIAPVPGVSVPIAEFPLILAPGWNQVGNPFDFPMAWASVRRSSQIGDPVAFDSQLGSYAAQSPPLLEPFEGYFIENASAAPETLYFEPVAADTVVHPNIAPESSEPTVSLELEARAAGSADLGNRLGLATDARAERDARDQAKPPPAPQAAVQVAIANRDWAESPGLYRRDFRAAGSGGKTWELEVTAAAGEPVELRLRSEQPLLPGASLRLVDREQGSTIDLPAGASEWRHTILAFGPAKAYRLALLMGAEDYVRAAASAPARLVLDPVAPNPARGAQRVRFGLPHAASVRLEVFDAAGRRVVTLLDGRTLPAGYHTAIWQPRRGSEDQVPSGIYFHRLTVGAETRTVRSVVVQ